MKGGPQPENLTGVLLVAHPMMVDPNFRHAILYLSHHSADDGALGFILNRPLGKKVGDWEMNNALQQVANVPLFEGGPVQRNQVIVASLDWNDKTSSCHFEPLAPPQGEFHLPEIEEKKLRVFLGYAGWSKNQLEQEIALHSWLLIHPHPELLRHDTDDTTWHHLMNNLGPMYRLLANAPEDNSQN